MKFSVKYKDRAGNICSTWTRAHDQEEAAENALYENWDIMEVIEVKPYVKEK